ncbi:MAG: protein phosphatase 2C domain-containing protein [Leptolyngbyaceae bacterium]|nr:protein phosphatase 2C domain-containing protein [Leptolyngbyaceae bacterium]
MLYCPNYSCQAPNAESHHFCERCRTLLPKRYLWALGEAVNTIAIGQLLGNRYVCKAPRIFLDTQPGVPPDAVDDIPESALPYLKLNAYRAHVPQAYGWVVAETDEFQMHAVLLLEYGAIATPLSSPPSPLRQATSSSPAHELPLGPLPSIAEQWSTATAMRQLNWLWQMAKLWQPLASERVVSTLVNPDLIRVEDSLIRLLELQHDQRQTANVGASLFHQLGYLWQQWLDTTQPQLQPFLKELCHHLIEGAIQHPGQIVACLDRALIAAGQVQDRYIQFASQTDKGPTRPRNEDACYPPKPGTVYLNSKKSKTTAAQLEASLVMVCDGIGGHLGGAVASSLAIDAVYQHLHALPLGRMRPLTLITELRKAVCAANDLISERNDHEERRERERMGTTLVMGLIQNHELYVTHLGDSRAYLITRQGCHQITLDDDVASREARLGYGLYRHALIHPGSGSLVQALGMASSGSLHPTVQRLVLEGEGILLLCSDGLSDNDLIDGLWQSYLLPLLEADTSDSSTVDLANVVSDLVNEANQKNGHDNVSVSLVRWSAHHSSPFTLEANLAIPPKLTSSIPGLTSREQAPSEIPTAPDNLIPAASPTKIVTPPEPSTLPTSTKLDTTMGTRSLVSLLVGIVFLMGLGSVLAYVLLPSVSDRIDTWLGLKGPSTQDRPEQIESDDDPLDGDPGTPDDLENPTAPLTIGAFVQVIRTDLGENPESVGESAEGGDRLYAMLYPDPSFLPPDSSAPANAPASSTAAGTPQPEPPSVDSVPDASSVQGTQGGRLIERPTPVAAGTVLRIIRQQEDDEQRRWIHLRVCQVATNPDASSISGETQAPLPPSPSSEPELRVGQIGWMAEEELRTVADLRPSVNTSELEPCRAEDSAS